MAARTTSTKRWAELPEPLGAVGSCKWYRSDPFGVQTAAIKVVEQEFKKTMKEDQQRSVEEQASDAEADGPRAA